jgi:hypothetical protein
MSCLDKPRNRVQIFAVVMRIVIIGLQLLGIPLCGAEFWVDGNRGDDANPGTKSAPFASIEAGLQHVTPGSTLHILPGREPWPTDIRITANGTSGAPIVIDGHGSLASGRGAVPLEEWEAVSDGVYRRPLPNNAWGMPHHWEGGFPLVWFDGKAAANVTNRDELKPGSYFLYKNQPEHKTDKLHNTLFICLPEEADPETIQIETIIGEGGIFVGGDHVTVRNFVVEYGGRDGYATHRNRGVVFENVEARYFMDQGMSHHGAEVLVRNAHFHSNAGAGIVDVYPEVKVRYENCLIEKDTWRGGVEFHSGQFEMVNCHIRGNPKASLTVTKGALVSLTNCLIDGGSGGETGVRLSEGSQLKMNRSTIQNFQTGLQAVFSAETRLVVENCAFVQNGAQLSVTVTQRLGAAKVEPEKQMSLLQNEYGDAPFVFVKKEEHAGGWKVETASFEEGSRSGFWKRFGGDGRESGDESGNAGADVSKIPGH